MLQGSSLIANLDECRKAMCRTAFASTLSPTPVSLSYARCWRREAGSSPAYVRAYLPAYHDTNQLRFLGDNHMIRSHEFDDHSFTRCDTVVLCYVCLVLAHQSSCAIFRLHIKGGRFCSLPKVCHVVGFKDKYRRMSHRASNQRKQVVPSHMTTVTL